MYLAQKTNKQSVIYNHQNQLELTFFVVQILDQLIIQNNNNNKKSVENQPQNTVDIQYTTHTVLMSTVNVV